ncbi:MAG: hypothetical protein QE263_00355 [Vampirovibrionales bacterium]|nr:hypothetical protein [Vampirovibrionales bacterium]
MEHSQGAASAAWRPRQTTFLSLAVGEDSFTANNPLPTVDFGKSALKKSAWLLALVALLAGQTCKEDESSSLQHPPKTVAAKKAIKGFVPLPPDLVVHWTQGSLYHQAAQGLRIHAGHLLKNRETNGLNDVEIFDSLATIAARRSGDDPETFMRLMGEVFFNHLSKDYRLVAGIPDGNFNGGLQFQLGNTGLAIAFSDPKDPEQISKHFLYLAWFASKRGKEMAMRALAINESIWFGEDPSEADIRLGELAINIGEALRRGKKPSQIDWKGLLSGEATAVNP